MSRKYITSNSPQHLFLFILSSFNSKIFGDILEGKSFLKGNLFTRMSPNVCWPCRTSTGPFLLARSLFFGIFTGLGPQVSVEPCLWVQKSVFSKFKLAYSCIFCQKILLLKLFCQYTTSAGFWFARALL